MAYKKKGRKKRSARHKKRGGLLVFPLLAKIKKGIRGTTKIIKDFGIDKIK